MNYLWFLFALLAGGADIAYNYVTRRSLQKPGRNLEFAWGMTAVRSLVTLPAILELKNLKWSGYSLSVMLALVVVTFINILIFMKMHATNELSISTIIVRLRAVWASILAIFLVGEVLSPYNYLGILIVFVAMVIISPPKKLVKDKAMGTAFIFSITVSFLLVIQKAAAALFPTQLIILAMSLPTVLFLPLVTRNAKEKILSTWNKNLKDKLLIASASMLTIYLHIAAYDAGGKVGPTTAVFQGVSVFAVVVGIAVLKERTDLVKKIFAAILATIGVILLI